MKETALKRKVSLFYALAFAIGWASWWAMSRVYEGQPPGPLVYVFSTLGGLSPLISLAILDRMTRKEVSLRQILSQIRLRGTRPVWFLLAAFAYPLVTLLSIAGSYLLGADRTLQWIQPGPAELGAGVIPIMALHFAASLVTSPLFEEPGWRGFALGHLQGRFGRLLGSLIVGVLWWAWHQPMNLTFGLQPTLPSFLSMLALSFMIDSIFNLSGKNLLTAMLAHQSSGTALAFLSHGSLIWLQVGLLVALVVGLRLREHTRPPIPSAVAPAAGAVPGTAP